MRLDRRPCDCGMYPMFALRNLDASLSLSAETSVPETTTLPESGLRVPAIRFTRDDFPLPDFPMTVTKSPSPISSDTPSTALNLFPPRSYPSTASSTDTAAIAPPP